MKKKQKKKQEVSQKSFVSNWDLIFSRKKKRSKLSYNAKGILRLTYKVAHFFSQPSEENVAIKLGGKTTTG